MKINNIDYNSNTASFLKMSEINSIEKEFSNIIDKIANEIHTPLGNEMKEGSGLDCYAFNVNGESKANTVANDIYKQLALVITNLSSSKEIIVENAKKHRDKEYETYIEKLTEKINRLESEKKQIMRKIDNTNPVDAFFGSYYQEKIRIQNEINRWSDKRTQAEIEWDGGK